MFFFFFLIVTNAVGLIPTTTEPVPVVTAAPKAITTPVAKSGLRMNGLMALGLSMLPTVALSLPMIAPFLGRKRRQVPALPDWMATAGMSEEDDPLVRDFTQNNQEEMQRKDISVGRCRQLVYDKVEEFPVLICPGETSGVLNMIRLLD